jgi:hypothetical protein
MVTLRENVQSISQRLSNWLSSAGDATKLPKKSEIWSFISCIHDDLEEIAQTPENLRSPAPKKSSTNVIDQPQFVTLPPEKREKEAAKFVLALDDNLPSSTLKLAQEILSENVSSSSSACSDVDADFSSSSPSPITIRTIKRTKKTKSKDAPKKPVIDLSTQPKKPKSSVPSDIKVGEASVKKSRRLVGVLSDSVLRPLSSQLPTTFDTKRNIRHDFLSFAIGGATISSMTAAVENGEVPLASADVILIHVGVNDLAGRNKQKLTPDKFSSACVKLVETVRRVFGVDEVILSHVLPLKSDQTEARSIVQQANIALDFAARLVKCEVLDLNKFMFRGSFLKADYYLDDRHITPQCARYLSYRVRELFGLPPREPKPRYSFVQRDFPSMRSGFSGEAPSAKNAAHFLPIAPNSSQLPMFNPRVPPPSLHPLHTQHHDQSQQRPTPQFFHGHPPQQQFVQPHPPHSQTFNLVKPQAPARPDFATLQQALQSLTGIISQFIMANPPQITQ